MLKRWLPPLLFLLAARADTLLLTPPAGNRTEPQIASGASLEIAASLAGVADPLAIIPAPQVAKIYVVGRTPGDGIAVFDYSGTTLLRRVTLPSNAFAAALSPDGTRLAVAMDLIRILDTSTDIFVNASALNTGIVEMAFSADSTQLYALGARLFVLDVASFSSLAASEEFIDSPRFLSVSPLGRLFVTAANRILEFDPRTALRRNQWTLAGNLQRPVLSADGQRFFLPLSNTTGPAIGILPLGAGFLSQFSIGEGSGFSQIFQVGPTRLLAISSGAVRTVYQVDLDPVRLAPYAPAVQAGVNEALMGAYTPGTLYVLDNGRLRRISLATGTVSSAGPVVPYFPSAVTVLPPSLGAPASSLTPLNPTQTLLTGSVSSPLLVRALDELGRPATGARIQFTSPDSGVQFSSANAFVSAEGIASTVVYAPSVPGPFLVNASAPGSTTAPAAFQLTAVNAIAPPGLLAREGNGAILQTMEPRVVTAEVRDTFGAPLVGQSVSWRIVSGRGAISNLVTTTDAQGVARITYTPGDFEDPDTFTHDIVLEARSGATAVRYQLTQLRGSFPPGICVGANYPPPRYTLLEPTTQRVTGRAGETLKGGIKLLVEIPTGCSGVNDAVMTPVGNVSFRIAPGGPAACAGDVVFTDGGNPATCDVVFGRNPGTGVLNLIAGGEALSLNVGVDVQPGAPAALRPISGSNQAARPNEPLPTSLAAIATDVFGNPVVNVPVRFQPSSGMTVSNVAVNTGFDGRAQTAASLGNATAPQTVRASVAGAPPASFLITPNASVNSLIKTGGDNQAALLGQEFPRLLELDVIDGSGGRVRGVPVNFRVRSGPAVLPSYTAITSEEGKALLAVRAGYSEGVAIVEAFVGTVSTQFTLTASATPRQPMFTRDGVVNEASKTAGAFAAGTVVRISGTQLGPKDALGAALTPDGRVASTLGGVRVLWDNNPSPLLSVQENAIVCVVPFVLGAGTVSLVVETEAGRSAALQVEIRQTAPAIFPDLIYNADFTRNTGSQRSQPGAAIILYATGGGQTDPPSSDGKVSVPPLEHVPDAEVWVNGQRCELIYAGAAPGAVAGYIQLVARLPESLPRGTTVEVEFRAQGVRSAAGPVIYVAP